MLVQDTSIAACHTGRSTTRTVPGETETFQPELAQSRSLAALPDAGLPTVTVDEQAKASGLDRLQRRQAAVLNILPKAFEQGDYERCPDCVGTGITVDDDGTLTGTRDALTVCGCMALDSDMTAWIDYVVNQLFERAAAGA